MWQVPETGNRSFTAGMFSRKEQTQDIRRGKRLAVNEQRLAEHFELRGRSLEREGSHLSQLQIKDLQSISDEGILQIPSLPPLLPEFVPVSFLLMHFPEGRIQYSEGRGQTCTLIRGQSWRRDGHMFDSSDDQGRKRSLCSARLLSSVKLGILRKME